MHEQLHVELGSRAAVIEALRERSELSSEELESAWRWLIRNSTRE
jgi:hypothetical protein